MSDLDTQQTAPEQGPALGMKYRRAVREHARRHYEQGGWDFIYEGFENGELAELIGDAESAEEAIALAGKRARELNARRLEQGAGLLTD